jgi:hypothetical protein
MSVEQRAAAAMRETVASDAKMRAPLHELLAAFGHACSAAAERERDTALDQLSAKPTPKQPARPNTGERTTAASWRRLRRQRDALLEALKKALPFIGWAQSVPDIVAEAEQAIAAAEGGK